MRITDATTPTRRELTATRGGELYLGSWLLHRLVVGVLGIAMPPALILGQRALFDSPAVAWPRASLSAYYYSGVRDVFVATLAATGVFLVTYMALHANWDNAVSTLAGLAALTVAFFPTGPDGPVPPAAWPARIGVHTCQTIHFTAAMTFIGALAVMSWRFGLRDADRAHRRTAFLHTACALVMAAALLTAGAGAALGVQRVGPFSGLLLAELTCTYAFGLSWLVKGAELRRVLAAARTR